MAVLFKKNNNSYKGMFRRQLEWVDLGFYHRTTGSDKTQAHKSLKNKTIPLE